MSEENERGHWQMRLELALFQQASSNKPRTLKECAEKAEYMHKQHSKLKEKIHEAATILSNHGTQS